MELQENALLALDTIHQKPTTGIPSWLIHPMEHRIIDRLAGVPEGSYIKNPDEIYLKMQRNVGTCLLDQYLATNPLSMGAHGYDNDKPKTATTGLDHVVCDGIVIDSPEAVVEHMEKVSFPDQEKKLAEIRADLPAWQAKWAQEILKSESQCQDKIGPTMLKSGYGPIGFPGLRYGRYGYVNYFMAYALYPDVIERDFALQTDYWELMNQATASIYEQNLLPPLYRLDHDMADSRGTLVDIKSLDKIWFPHFARSLAPLLKTPLKMIWHCDGNLSQMVPRLLEVGLKGFQGFQYEDGMDYEKICKMKTRDGDDLIIVGGVSVTRTLPFGKPEDVRKQIAWLVEKGPETGLFLAGSSSIAPGVPWGNMQALVEGLKYYRANGRK
ncbi:MAG: uroporphyrinogen decarboxylase family protein [Kiritimatiellae bacterium]|nr:uroporphyrinogen decarboxylase family protein [Kiritimatiellia bacterium]